MIKTLLYRYLGGFPTLPVVAVLTIFLALRFVFIKAGTLPAAAYESWSITAEIFGNLPRALIAIGILVVLVFHRRKLCRRWDQWEEGGIIRALVLVAASVIVWPYAFYEYNHYFGEWHLADRALLLALYLGLWWRPAFILPFVPLAIAIAGQLIHPVGGYSWAAPDQAFHLLMLFAAFALYSWIRGPRESRVFLYLAAVVIVLHYWPSGAAKLWRNWIVYDQIHLILPNAHTNGWLRSLSQETLATWTSLLSTASPALKIFTLTAECSCLFFFWKRPFALAIIAAWILFHAGVLLTSGIFFWQWIVLDAALFFLVWKFPRAWSTPGFTKAGFIIAFGLIGTSIVWLRPASLSWSDSPATYSFRFEGITADGTAHHLPPSYFAPYDYAFSIGGFRYLSDEKTLGIALGATSKDLAKRLYHTESAEDILAIESESGRSHLMPVRQDKFITFLTRFAQSTNQDPKNSGLLQALAPPHLLQTSGDDTTYRFGAPLHRIDVIEILSHFDGERIREIRRRKILQVDIPQG